MKKVSFYLLLVGIVGMFSACQSDEKEITEIIEETTNEVWSENGIPAFKDEATFVDAMISAATMSQEQRTKWEEKVGFFSLWSAYDLASEEYDQIASEEEYLSFKENYQDLFVFAETKDDMAFFFKVEDMSSSLCLDMYGQAIIGGELKSFNKVNSMSFWNDTEPKLKGGREVDLGTTCVKRDGRRYMRCYQKRVHPQNINPGYLVYIAGQKKGWFGWNNYKTQHYIKPLYGSVYLTVYNNQYNEANGLDGTWATPTDPYSKEAKYTWRFYFGDTAMYVKVWTRGVGEDDACIL